MRRQGLLVGLLLAGTAMSTLAASPAVAQTTAARDSSFVDLKVHNDEIEAWRNAQYDAARRQGKATRAEFHRIDTEALRRARAAEIHRTRALEALSKTAKVPLGQGPGGTQPLEGRGTLGDIDTASLSGKDFNEVQKAAKKAGYTVVQQGDAFTIKELDVTVHRAPAAKAPSQVGSSGRAAEIGRGYNPETAMGLGANDPALSVADNLKKAAHTVNTPPDQISSADLQKLGKMTGRNVDAVATVTGQPIDPVTRAQADMLKQNYSPEASGIVRDNATPAQRAEDIAAFQKKAKQVTIDAARAADVSANKAMEKLAAEARHANDVLEAVRQTGDADRIARAKANVENANRAVIEYAETRAAAQKSAVLNDADAAKIVNEARGIPYDGKPPSQIRKAAFAGDRKALTAAAAEPTRPPGLSEGAAGQATGSLKSTLLKGAGLGATILQVVQGVARGAEEAGKYAGEQSAEQWAKDVREGRVDPNSRLSQWYAKIRGVGWGVAEFTGLQAIKDATIESAGYVTDRYGQYKNEKIEAKASAEAKAAAPAGGARRRHSATGHRTRERADQARRGRKQTGRRGRQAGRPGGSQRPGVGRSERPEQGGAEASRAHRPGYRRRRSRQPSRLRGAGWKAPMAGRGSSISTMRKAIASAATTALRPHRQGDRPREIHRRRVGFERAGIAGWRLFRPHLWAGRRQHPVDGSGQRRVRPHFQHLQGRRLHLELQRHAQPRRQLLGAGPRHPEWPRLQ